MFGCFPDNKMLTKEDMFAIRDKASAKEYESRKSAVKGNAVEFPIHFLEDDLYKTTMTKK